MKTRRLAALVVVAALSSVPPALATSGWPESKTVRPKPHSSAVPPELLPDGRKRLLWIEFGLREAAELGVLTYDGTAPSAVFAWEGGMTRLVARKGMMKGVGGGDFYEGTDASFVVSIRSPGACRIHFVLGDPGAARGPIDIKAGRDQIAFGVTTRAGQFVDLDFDADPEKDPLDFDANPVKDRLAVYFKGRDCASFAVVSVAVYAPPGASITRDLFPPPGPARPEDARLLLRDCCDFLLNNQPAEGGFSYNGSWYQSSYPVRTLLAGGQLLYSPRYTEAALTCLDRFVSEQERDGRWASGYFGKAGCPGARQEVAQTASANLADVGCQVLALELGAPEASPERRKRYLAAAVRYADLIVLPHQLADGAFPNLLFAGVDYQHPYSVSTGIQAANLSALYGLTRDARYLGAAERAARHLLSGFRADGQFSFEPHDGGAARLISPCRFGDMLYVFEGLIFVRRTTADSSLRAEISQQLDAALFGSSGIASQRKNGALWKAKDFWEASKQGALFMVLADARLAAAEAGRPTDPIDRWIDDYTEWLALPANAWKLGVFADPASADGRLALPATGFAGVGLGEILNRSPVAHE